MLFLDTWRKGRKVFSPIWLWVALLLTKEVTVQGKTIEELHSSSQSCDKNKTVTCHATDKDKDYRLDNFQWYDVNKVVIYNNDSELMLEDPLCSDNSKQEVVVFNSIKVTTEPGETNCSQQLILHSSKNIRITDGVNLVRLIDSKAYEITLPRVSQFDLSENSWVGRVSVTVDQDKSTITNSTIELVERLIIDGSFEFMVKESSLKSVKGFVYNSSKSGVFRNVTVGSVADSGFVVSAGSVVIQDCFIATVRPQGMLVKGNSTLRIHNSILYSVAYNSIVLEKGSSLYFRNVTVGGTGGIYLTLKDATMGLFPLALLRQFHGWTPHGWVALYVSVALVLGFLVGVATMFYYQRRCRSLKTQGDTTELLAPSTLPPNITNSKANRPLPDKPTTNEEVYEQYTDVAQHLVPGVGDQRPPVHVPDESSSTGGSTVPVNGQYLPMHTTGPNPGPWRNPKVAGKRDERDDLPPPPPPEPGQEAEELYDELEGPMPPPQEAKPTRHPLPKPPLPMPPFMKRPPPPTPSRNQ